jgi:diguanylate cyclase (GGDEF)-like protein
VDLPLVDRDYKDWLSSNRGRHADSVFSAPPRDSDLVFLMLDVDHFKWVNDTYGHSAGDRVLEQFSRLLKETLRDSDHLVRWGGEEFLVVARFCSRDNAAEMAERIRQAVASYSFNIGGDQQLKKTCSIGFATYPFYQLAPDALTWEQVIDAADHALYAAKKSGRDCWVGFSAPPGDVSGLNPFVGDKLDQLLDSGTVRVHSSIPDKPYRNH